MGMITDYERIRDAGLVSDWKKTAKDEADHINLTLGKIVAMKTTYPADATELQTIVDNAVAYLQGIIDVYLRDSFCIE